MTTPWRVTRGEGPIVAVALHDGHLLDPDVAASSALDEATRLREEDPYTGRVAEVVPTSLVVTMSRFQVDLNRPRDRAIYRTAEDAWGLEPWRVELPPEAVARGLEYFDTFYAALDELLREVEARHGAFVVLDVHSYCHRRGGPDATPTDPAEAPQLNLGTRSVRLSRWGELVDGFVETLRRQTYQGAPLDVRTNVVFGGGHMARWINRRFPETGCCLAIELKKTFVDEWTGALDQAALDDLCSAVAATVEPLQRALGRSR